MSVLEQRPENFVYNCLTYFRRSQLDEPAFKNAIIIKCTTVLYIQHNSCLLFVILLVGLIEEVINQTGSLTSDWAVNLLLMVRK